MNLVVNYIFSAVNAFPFFLYMFEVGSVTTRGPLFLLEEHKQPYISNIQETLQQCFSSGNKVGGRRKNLIQGE